MNNRRRREQELKAMYESKKGMQTIVELYHEKVVGKGNEGEPGITALQMIPLILDAEFRDKVK